MSASFLFRLNAVLLALFAVGCVLAWEQVPERLPLHFGLAGKPDAWIGRSLAVWMGPPTVAAALAAFIYATHRAARPYPKTWKVPERELLLRLPEDAHAAVWEIMERTVAVTLLLITVIFVSLQVGTLLVAAGWATRIPWYLMAVEAATLIAVVARAAAGGRQARRYLLARAAEETSSAPPAAPGPAPAGRHATGRPDSPG